MPVDVASMSNSQYQDEKHGVLDVVDDAVVAHASAIAIRGAAQLLAAPRTRGVCEFVYSPSDSSLKLRFKLRERACRRRRKFKVVESQSDYVCRSGTVSESCRVVTPLQATSNVS